MKPKYQTSQRSSSKYKPRRIGRQAHLSLPNRAFVACRDSASTIRGRMIDYGCSLVGCVILSVQDNASLQTVEAILGSLPESIRVMFVDDIEYLLPVDQRTPESVLRLAGRIRAFTAQRGITGYVSTGIDVLGGVVQGAAQ